MAAQARRPIRNDSSMTSALDQSFRGWWFPVVRSQEVGLRHIHRSQLLNQELAIWRDDDGQINAWENRCPHRGTRLSIGLNTGAEIRCQYHGWRYASQSGQCTFIPAHPAMEPSPRYCVNTFECIEKYGYVWVRLEKDKDEDIGSLFPLTGKLSLTTLRSVYTTASTTRIRDWLISDCESQIKVNSPSLECSLTEIQQRHSFCLEALSINNQTDKPVTIFIYLHPLTDDATVIHPVVKAPISPEIRLDELRCYNRLFGTIRDACETGNVLN